MSRLWPASDQGTSPASGFANQVEDGLGEANQALDTSTGLVSADKIKRMKTTRTFDDPPTRLNNCLQIPPST
jgi:hypothetical protein